MVKARQWLLADRPSGVPKLEGPNQTFKLVETELPDPQADELLVKLVYLSNDPIQREWVNLQDPERFYRVPMNIGSVMDGYGLAVVVESKASTFSKGDYVIANTGWSEYAVVPASAALPAPELPGGVARTHYLGALGSTGLAAYFVLTSVTHATKDDVVVISGAAGATGSMAVQIAKKVIGCKKVIAIAGTDEKCKWVESLGADLCLNYKSPTFANDFRKATPGSEGFVNVYIDLVGGKILELAFSRMAKYGRIAALGDITNYNGQGAGLKNWMEVIKMSIEIRGFNFFNGWDAHIPEGVNALTEGLEKGQLDISGGEHIVKAGFEEIPKTWMMLFSGSNTGKLVTALD